MLAAYPRQLYTTCKITCWTVSLTCDSRVKRCFPAIAAGVAAYPTISPQFSGILQLDSGGLIELEAEVLDHAVRVGGFLTGCREIAVDEN